VSFTSRAQRVTLTVDRHRTATLGLLACASIVATALVGASAALAYLAPALLLFALLLFGRYPGEDAYRSRLAPARRAAHVRPAVLLPRPAARSRLPRGGALLGAALAGRAPPRPAG
jgi:hypothetical protein